jgi:hypothetical protein
VFAPEVPAVRNCDAGTVDRILVSNVEPTKAPPTAASARLVRRVAAPPTRFERRPFRAVLASVASGRVVPATYDAAVERIRPNAVRAPDDERPSRPREPYVDDDTLLDRHAHTAALLAPPSTSPATRPTEVTPPPSALPPDAHAIALEVVERLSIWGDGTRGLARLRFGGRARGGLAGASVSIEQDESSVVVRVDGASPPDLEALRERLARLGVEVEER